jgi:hypothetical protein
VLKLVSITFSKMLFLFISSLFLPHPVHIIKLLMRFIHPSLISQQPVLRHSQFILRDRVSHLMVIRCVLVLDHSKSETLQTNVYQDAQTLLCVSFKYALNLLYFGTGHSATCLTGHFVKSREVFTSANKMAKQEMKYKPYI